MQFDRNELEEVLNYVDEKLELIGVAEELKQIRQRMDEMQYEINELLLRTKDE